MHIAQGLKLGEILVQEGWVHTDQVNEALELQKLRARRIGEILLELGYVEEESILRALGIQFGLEYEPNVRDQVDATLTTKVPISFIREYHMVPYKKNGASYLVAINDPINLLPLDDLRLLLDGSVTPTLCSKSDNQFIINTSFEQQSENAGELIDNIVLSGEEDGKVHTLDHSESERDLLDLANEAPIIKLINLIISGAVKERASDIHLEPFEHTVRARYRIDGVLYEKFTVPKTQQAALVQEFQG